MSETGHQVAADSVRPPPARTGALGWARMHLFSSVFNTALTILAVGLLVLIVPPVVEWLILDAVWAAPADVCRGADGACWAFIYEKHRIILFGRYPFAEHWRPLIAILLLVALLGLSCNRAFWRAWLGLVWLGGLGAVATLMWGGVFGLSFVKTAFWGGLPLTLILSVVGVVFAFPISILLALGRRSGMPLIRAVCVSYIELIRGVPLITLLFMASFMFPLFLPTGANIDELLRAQIAIVMFTSAYLAEVIRGGLQAIPKGQYEAAEAMGLTYWQAMGLIILPQAIRIVIPPIVNTFISMFKDTSLVLIISLTDLLLAVRLAFSDPEWRAFFVEGYIFVALIYFCFCFFMSKYSQYLEAQLDTEHRR